MTVVDAHVHVWDPAAVPGELGPPGAAGRMLAALDQARIDAAVLVQPSVHATDHRYLLAAVDLAPEHLVAVVLADPDVDDPLAPLPVGDPRVRGLRVPLIRTDGAWLDRHGEALFARSRDERWVVGAFVRTDQLSLLEPLLERHPDVPVVIDHLGRLDLAGGAREAALVQLLGLARHPQVHVKLSALAVLSSEPPPYADVHDDVQRVLGAFGPARALWGSDYPNILANAPYDVSLSAARTALGELPGAGSDAVLGGTARALYFERAG